MATGSDNLTVYTIEVGTAGTYTNDANVDVSKQINAEIASAPSGDEVSVIFNPGVYGVVTPILLPSNSKVIGNNGTLTPLVKSGWLGNSALIANKDAYDTSNDLYVRNSDGTTTTIVGSSGSSGSTDTVGMDASTAIIDTNISIKGMTFNETGYWVFGTWFTNAENIDVQNNTYIGGADGNAFVNVVDGIVANNIAVGQENAAYDDWNGPTNVTIEDNLTYVAGTSDSGWSVLINSTPSGDVYNPGNANNDGVVDNLFSGYYVNSPSGNADPLLSYGPTTMTNITQQGNITSSLNVPNSGQFYSANIISGDIIENDVFTGINESSTFSYNIISALSSSATLASGGKILGNLILGAYDTGNAQPLIENSGSNPTTVDNAVVNASTYSSTAISTSSLNSGGTALGNILTSGTTVVGTGVLESIGISAPSNVLINPNSTTNISGLAIDDLDQSDALTISLEVTFGTLAFPDGLSGANYVAEDGEQQIILTGSFSQINEDLRQLDYTGNALGWDDAIEVNVSNAAGLTATRYIPVIVDETISATNELTILPAGYMGSLKPESVLFPGSTLLAEPVLSGEIAIASSGDNLISMGSSISVAFLGCGSNTVVGGSHQEYIAAEGGNANVSLTGGGDVTVAGGDGSIVVIAAAGNDLIQSGIGQMTVTTGSGSDTFVGGLGDATLIGGSGPLLVTTLPEDGGDLLVDPGSGNSTLFALSGRSTISTSSGTANLIYSGIGTCQISSAGNDTIYTGAGATSIFAVENASDQIVAGSGNLTFVSSSSTSSSSTIMAGLGNISVSSSGAITDLVVNEDLTTNRTIAVANDFGGVTLAPGLSVVSESMAGETLILQLSDKTTLDVGDPSGSAIWELNGTLAADHISLTSSIAFLNDSATTSNITWSIIGSTLGFDTIDASFSCYACRTAGSDNVVQLAGNSSLIAGGDGDLIAAVGGTNIVSVTGIATAIISDSSDTIYAAPGGSLVDAFFVGYTGGSLVFINQSTAVGRITGDDNCLSGSLTVVGGIAGGYYQGGMAGNNSLVGGTGTDGTTLIGAGDNNFLSVQGSGNNALFAGPQNAVNSGGSSTLAAGAATDNNVFVAGNGTESLISYGFGSQDFFVGSGGSATITGSQVQGALNNFYFDQAATQGGGTVVITNFNFIQDNIFINPFGGSGVYISAVQNVPWGNGSESLIELNDNTIIKLLGVTLNSSELMTIVGGTSL